MIFKTFSNLKKLEKQGLSLFLLLVLTTYKFLNFLQILLNCAFPSIFKDLSMTLHLGSLCKIITIVSAGQNSKFVIPEPFSTTTIFANIFTFSIKFKVTS